MKTGRIKRGDFLLCVNPAAVYLGMVYIPQMNAGMVALAFLIMQVQAGEKVRGSRQEGGERVKLQFVLSVPLPPLRTDSYDAGC